MREGRSTFEDMRAKSGSPSVCASEPPTPVLIADTTPPLIQAFFLGVPLMSLLLGLVAPRWTLGVPVAATFVLVAAALTGGDPADMPGAGVFFAIMFGIAFVAPWFLGRVVRLVFRSASRRRRTRSESDRHPR